MLFRSGRKLQEGLSEAGGEGGRRLGDAALGTGQLGGKAGQEVVLRLLRRQHAHGRQYAKRVRAQEDDTSLELIQMHSF